MQSLPYKTSSLGTYCSSLRCRVILLGTIIAIGILCSWWLGAQANREIRADLLDRARMVADSLNIATIRGLTGTEADLVTPEYLRLKEQFAAVCAANPQCRFVYLMGRRPTKATAADNALADIFFFIDSEPVGSGDESPPGQVYGEVPKGYRHVFNTGMAAVDGSVTDRWGTKDHVTVSTGCNSVYCNEETSGADLLQKADEALYIAKNQGRDRVGVSD